MQDLNALPTEPMDDMEPDGEATPAMDQARAHAVTLQRLAEVDNAAETIDQERLAALGQLVCREYAIDKDSRTEWERSANKAMAIAQQKREEKTTPWPGASNVKYPMLTTAALQFAARAYPAIIDGNRVVKASVVGMDPDGQKAGKADRVSAHMSYQLLYELPEWEADVDTLLHQIPIIGCAFRKVYADPTKKCRFSSDLVSAFDLVVNQSARSLDTVPRLSHVFKLYPHEVDERMRDGRFIEVDLKLLSENGEDSSEPTTFIEQHRYWDLDQDGYAEPWIVTVHERTQTVVRVRANFDGESIDFDQMRGRIKKITRRDYFVLVPFIPDPEGGFYPIGFGKLLEPLSDVIDATINQMMDAGTLQNSGGGFIGSGLQLGKGKITMRPGEYRVVTAAGQEIRNSIVNLEHPGASPVLFQLLGMMIESAKDIAAIKDILTGEPGRTQTATTTLALIEQGMKVFTAIYKRVHRALKREYTLIFDINKKAMRTYGLTAYVTMLDKPAQVVADDYDDMSMDIQPVADPNLVTDMQRLTQAQLLMQMVQEGNPHINAYAATKRVLEAARIEGVEEMLVAPPEQPPPAEMIQMEGAVAEVEKVKADAKLKNAQAIKTEIEAGIAANEPIGDPMQPETMDENGRVTPPPQPGPSLADIQMMTGGPPMQEPQPEMMPQDMGGQMPPEGMPLQ